MSERKWAPGPWRIDAHLIAAAPEMFEELAAVLAILRPLAERDAYLAEEVEEIERILAKAEGRDR